MLGPVPPTPLDRCSGQFLQLPSIDARDNSFNSPRSMLGPVPSTPLGRCSGRFLQVVCQISPLYTPAGKHSQSSLGSDVHFVWCVIHPCKCVSLPSMLGPITLTPLNHCLDHLLQLPWTVARADYSKWCDISCHFKPLRVSARDPRCARAARFVWCVCFLA